jgi:hypothetical protein
MSENKVDIFLYEFWYYQMGYLTAADIEKSVIEKFSDLSINQEKA